MKNTNKNRVFRFNRRIRGQTDYQQRLNLLKSKLPRVVVRRSNKNTLVQIVEYAPQGDKIVTSAKAVDLVKLGFKANTGNLTAAYLTGYLAGKRALKKKLKSECIVDLGLQNIQYGSRLFAAVKGMIDAGVNVKASDVVFPAEERLNGSHLKVKDAAKLVEKVKGACDKL